MKFARAIKSRRRPDDVVKLPLSGWTRSIHQRRVLVVNRRGRAIRIGLVFVRIQHLEFVTVQSKKNAAVAPALALAPARCRRRPLNVKLAVSETLQCPDVAASRHAFHRAVADGPFGRAANERHPLREVRSVEQDDRIGGRLAWLLQCARRSRIDCRRQGTGPIVSEPIWVRLGKGRGVAQRSQGDRRRDGDAGPYFGARTIRVRGIVALSVHTAAEGWGPKARFIKCNS